MTYKLQVKEHLKNDVLYHPLDKPSLSGDWKRKLFYQHTLHQQLKYALQEKNPILKMFVCISVPIICISLAFAAYFGIIHPEHWFENIVPILQFNVPPIGLKEIIVFVAIVNGLTLLIRKRTFLL